MKLSHNVIAGIFSVLWTMIVGFLVVPFYLHYLGMQAYGLIGFFVTLQSLLNILDLGLAPTISREVARFASRGRIKDGGNLVHTLALIYWAVALLILFGFYLLAPAIAQHWLSSDQLPSHVLEEAVFLIGAIIACRWPHALYRGALLGAERLAVVSLLNIIMVTVAGAGAVAVLAFVSPSIKAYFLWQAGIGLLYTLVMRWLAWRTIGNRKESRFVKSELVRIWRFTAGAGSIAVVGLVLSQLDKLLLSRLLSLDDFGVYMLAVMVGSTLSALVIPVFNAAYPRFSALVAKNDTQSVINLYRSGTRLLATLLFPLAMVIGGQANGLVSLWTGDTGIALQTAPLILLLVCGSAIHGVMHFPYALQLAHGRTSIPLSISTLLIVISVPLLIFLTNTFGLLGGALAWLVQQLCYLFLSTAITHRYILQGLGARWLIQDVGIPAAIALIIGITSNYLILDLLDNQIVKLVCAVFFAGVSVLLILALSPGLVTLIKESLGQRSVKNSRT